MTDYSEFKKHINDFEKQLKSECEDIFLVHSSFRDIRDLVDLMIKKRDKKIQELENKLKKNDKSSTESSKPKKDCPSGKILNPKTNRCRKIKTPKKKVIKDNLTTEEKPKKECPPEKIINPKTGRCIKKPKEKTHKKQGEPKKGVKSTPAPEKSLSLSKNFDESLEHIRTTGKVGSYRNFLNGIKKKFGIILKYDNHGDDYAFPDLYFMKGKKEASREEMEKVMKYVIDASKKV